MPRQVDINFDGMEAAQGSTGSDRIPEGRYALKVSKFEGPMHNATNGNTTFIVTFEVADGDHRTKRIVDRFTKTTQQDFGFRRLMAFLGAVTGRMPSGQISFDMDKLIGRGVMADIRDNVIPANDRYSERITSQVDVYYALPGAAPAAAAAPAPTVAAPPVAPPAAPAPAAASAVAPAAAPEPVAAAAPAPAVAPTATVASEIDDLFS